MKLVHINESKFKELLNISDSIDDLDDELEKLNKEMGKVIDKSNKSKKDDSKKQTSEKETNKKLPFLTFYEEIVKFLKGILNDPIKTKPSEILIELGLSNGELRKKLYDYNVITKKENIDEPFDETTGKKTSRYYVSYKVHKEKFKDKIRKLYNDLFDINECITRDEINLMLNSPLTMGVISDERAPEYVKQATDIYNDIINSNTLYFIKKGNMLYPMGKAKDIIGKNKITYDEFDFGLSQKLVKNGYKIAINGDIK